MESTLQKMRAIILILILFLIPGFIFAADAGQLQLPQTSVNPGSFYYPFKRLIEKGRERFVFSAGQKKALYTSLLNTRLAELNFVVGNRLLSEIQGSSERFSYQAGILAEEVITQNKADEKQNLIKQFELYSKFLDGLRDKYPANSSFWMLIQHDINTLKILSENLR